MTSHEINLDIPESGAVFAFGKNVPTRFYIKNDAVVSAACGEGHALVVTSSGRLFAFGQNDYGQLGLGHRNLVTKPSCVKWLKEAGHKALRVACGLTHTLVVTEGGLVFGFGNNSDGQLAGPDTSYLTPVEIGHLAGKEIKDLAAGRSFNLVLTKLGEVLAWGSNSEGCLGQGAGVEEARDEAVRVDLPAKVLALSAGAYHCACVLEGGQLWAWGETEGGKLGVPGSEEGEYCYTPQRVPLPDGLKARSVACGLQHTLALTENGRVLACGTGDCGQLGLGTDCLYAGGMTVLTAVDDVEMTALSAGERHSACVSGHSGHLFAFGDALHGKLGPTSRLGQSNQYRPFRLAALGRLRVRRAVCGTLLTLVLAAPRSADDSELQAAANAEVAAEAVGAAEDDPLDPASAMSPRPMARTSLSATMPLLSRRGSRRSREKFRESREGAGRNGATVVTFDLVRPAGMNGGTFSEQIIRPKTMSAIESQPILETSAPKVEAASSKKAEASAGPVVAEPERSHEVPPESPQDEPIPPHVMAITQFDNLLGPPGDLSPDTEPDTEDAAAAVEEPPPVYSKPAPKRREKGVVKPLPPPPPPPKVKEAEEDEEEEEEDEQELAPAPKAIPATKMKRRGTKKKTLPPPPAKTLLPLAPAPVPAPGKAPAPAQVPAPAGKPPPSTPAAASEPNAAQVVDSTPGAVAAAGEAAAAPLSTDPDTATYPPEANRGAVKSVGCGRGGRRPPPVTAAPAVPVTAAPAGALPAGAAPVGAAESTNDGAATGTSGAVKGVGCGGRRARPPPAGNSKPLEAPPVAAAQNGEAAAANTTMDGGAAPAVADGAAAPAVADGTAAPAAADGAATAAAPSGDAAGGTGKSRSCALL